MKLKQVIPWDDGFFALLLGKKKTYILQRPPTIHALRDFQTFDTFIN